MCEETDDTVLEVRCSRCDLLMGTVPGKGMTGTTTTWCRDCFGVLFPGVPYPEAKPPGHPEVKEYVLHFHDGRVRRVTGLLTDFQKLPVSRIEEVTGADFFSLETLESLVRDIREQGEALAATVEGLRAEGQPVDQELFDRGKRIARELEEVMQLNATVFEARPDPAERKLRLAFDDACRVQAEAIKALLQLPGE